MKQLTEKIGATLTRAYNKIYIKLHSKLTENKGDGGQAVGWIVGIAVVLLVATALFLFKDKVVAFIGNATDFIDGDKNSNFKLS